MNALVGVCAWVLATLGPLPQTNVPVGKTLTDEKAVQTVVRLMQEHPCPEIGNILLPRLLKREISIDLGGDRLIKGTPVGFVLWTTPEGQESKTFVFDRRALADQDTSTTKDFQLALWHQYCHLKQLESGRYPLDCFRLKAESTVISEQLFVWIRRIQIEAYREELWLANRIGAAGDLVRERLLTVYRLGDQQKFEQEIDQILAANPALNKFYARK